MSSVMSCHVIWTMSQVTRSKSNFSCNICDVSWLVSHLKYHVSNVRCRRSRVFHHMSLSFVSHVSCKIFGQLLPDPVGDSVPSLTSDVLAALSTAATSGPGGQRASLQVRSDHLESQPERVCQEWSSREIKDYSSLRYFRNCNLTSESLQISTRRPQTPDKGIVANVACRK